MKYGFIEDHKSIYAVRVQCRVLGVSSSGYYRFKRAQTANSRALQQQLCQQIRSIAQQSHYSYGSPRIQKALQAGGYSCNRKRVVRLMRLCGVSARTKRRYVSTTDSKHSLEVAKNLLNQNFHVEAPNKVWLADTTYIWTQQGWLYLAVVLDLCSRRIVGWAFSERNDHQLVKRSVSAALESRRHQPGLVLHSDRGSQYAAAAVQQLLKDHSLQVSMSRAGNCYDNAPQESFFASLKKEWVPKKPYATRREAIASLFEYIEVFYNRRRLHSSIGYISPVDFENLHFS
jgi:putative transposase